MEGPSPHRGRHLTSKEILQPKCLKLTRCWRRDRRMQTYQTRGGGGLCRTPSRWYHTLAAFQRMGRGSNGGRVPPCWVGSRAKDLEESCPRVPTIGVPVRRSMGGLERGQKRCGVCTTQPFCHKGRIIAEFG